MEIATSASPANTKAQFDRPVHHRCSKFALGSGTVASRTGRRGRCTSVRSEGVLVGRRGGCTSYRVEGVPVGFDINASGIPNEKDMMSESCCCSRRACGLAGGYRYSYSSSSLDMMVLPFFSVELLTGRSASISGIVDFYNSVRAKRTYTLIDIDVLYSEKKISR